MQGNSTIEKVNHFGYKVYPEKIYLICRPINFIPSSNKIEKLLSWEKFTNDLRKTAIFFKSLYLLCKLYIQ